LALGGYVSVDEHIARLLSLNPAGHASLDHPWDVADLLDELRQAGAGGQAAELLARDPAAHVNLADLGGVAMLLQELHRAGAREQYTRLADQIAVGVDLDGPDTGDMGSLLVLLKHDVPSKGQAAVLVDRLPAEGHFYRFCSERECEVQYRFGREPDGRPASPWDWENLS
jgi:hypothetical protein